MRLCHKMYTKMFPTYFNEQGKTTTMDHYAIRYPTNGTKLLTLISTCFICSFTLQLTIIFLYIVSDIARVLKDLSRMFMCVRWCEIRFI